MARVDLNCDMGESFGAYRIGNDEAILDYVTSANVACGFHGGDPSVMRRTVQLAAAKGVAVGAHPGYRDLEGFGRRYMAITPQSARDLVVYQVGALQGFARAEGIELQHVKPHGAIYNAAAVDRALADAIAAAVREVDPGLVLFALAGGELEAAGRDAGLRVASEAFVDRTYGSDGKLTPRGQPGAMIDDEEVAVAQVVRFVKEGKVRSLEGIDVEVSADTMCIHGDGPNALSFAKLVRERLERSDIAVKAVGR